jgi:AmiR/NasT family two-component response regulator
LRSASIRAGAVTDSNVTYLRTKEETLRVRVAQLQRALDSRIVVEQAKGVLSERYAVSVDDAFAVLRSAARRTRVKVHDLAAEVVSSRTTPDSVTAEIGRRLIRGV